MWTRHVGRREKKAVKPNYDKLGKRNVGNPLENKIVERQILSGVTRLIIEDYETNKLDKIIYIYYTRTPFHPTFSCF